MKKAIINILIWIKWYKLAIKISPSLAVQCMANIMVKRAVRDYKRENAHAGRE